MKTHEILAPERASEALLIRKKQLEDAIRTTKRTLAAAPEGRLRICSAGINDRYYHVKNEEHGTNGIYISGKETKLIKALAQKDYGQKVLPILEGQLSGIQKALKALDKCNPEALTDKLNPQRKKIIEPVTLSREEYARRWLSVEYKGKDFLAEVPLLFTEKGERVRSKSEVIIADTLGRMGIPYRYEYPVNLNGIKVYPDFYCLNTRTRKEIIWEHFGMMDNIDYTENAVKKINLYQSCGMKMNCDLIVTMETSANPLNTKTVKELAELFLYS